VVLSNDLINNTNQLGALSKSAYTAVCYLRGTHILTSTGEIRVEDLKIGDRVVTRFNGIQSVKWIGRQSYDARFVKDNPDHIPVCIQAGALDDHTPARDLFVSPLHAIYLDGVLVPAKCLLNGASIRQVLPEGMIEYYHIELASHDVLIAEGALAESYLDEGNRAMFHNVGEHAALHPDAAPLPALACAERVEAGPALDSIRAALALRAESFGYQPPRTHKLTLSDNELTTAVIPEGIEEIHLLCASGRVPGDARMLGALIHGLQLDGVDLPLNDAALDRGFHPVEQHGAHPVRWSTGDAVLRVSPAPLPRVLEVRVGGRFTLAAAA
jgi:hypothetical protein